MRGKHLLLALLLIAVGCRQSVIHDLSETDATTLLVRLQSANLAADKERQADGKWTLTVPTRDAARAIKVIDGSRMLKVLDSPRLDKSSFTSSREDQRFQFERALSREIEKTLLSLRGVLEAKVHLNLPSSEMLFRRERTDRASGSALLVLGTEFSTSKEEIASLISGASGVSSDKISVLLTGGQEINEVPPEKLGVQSRTQETSTPDSERPLSTDKKELLEQDESTTSAPLSLTFALATIFIGIAVTLYFLKRSWGGRPLHV